MIWRFLFATQKIVTIFLHLGAYMLIYILIGPDMHELSCLLHALFVIKSSLCSLDQSHKLSRDRHSCYWLWLSWLEWYWTDDCWLRGTLMAMTSVPSLWVRRVKEMLSFSIYLILNLKHVRTGGSWLGSNQAICCCIVFLLILLSNLGL